MPGTKLGGQRAAATNKARYGDDFYEKMGAIGGKVSRGGGFASMSPEKIRAAGAKGGAISKRRKQSEIEAERLREVEDVPKRHWYQRHNNLDA